MAHEFDISALGEDEVPTRARLVRTVFALSLPAILSELSTTLMQYIDAGMVGSLGAHATAAIGLVESTIWLLDGWAMCAATGFTVIVAQLVGANKLIEARSVLREAIVALLVFSTGIATAGMAMASRVPAWLGGDPELYMDASRYFFVCSCAIVPVAMARLGTGMLQCSGNMRTPSVLNVLACVLDVSFNTLLIPRLGILGAALGTFSAQTIAAGFLLWSACVRSPRLSLRAAGPRGREGRDGGGDRGRRDAQSRRGGIAAWLPRAQTLRSSLTVSAPMLLERTVMSAAYIAGTVIVAPLGTVAVAANSLAVTAEAVCYMPGVGVSAAATTLVGQSVGAARRDLAERFAQLATGVGMVLMGAAGALMWLGASAIMGMLTPDAAVRALGVEVLRIEAFAEPLFGASIVAAGALRGAADTLVPSIIAVASMWGVRISVSALVAPVWGLPGVWAAMAGELCVRGALFLWRLLRGRWLDRAALALQTPRRVS